MLTAEQAKASLKKKGYSQRRAAAALGITLQYLSCVLNGHRVGRNVRRGIAKLPPSGVTYHMRGFALTIFRPTTKKLTKANTNHR